MQNQAAVRLLFICLTTFSVASCATVQVRHSVTPGVPPSFAGAVARYYGGSFYASISEFQALVRDNPADPLPRRELVALYEEAGEYSQAVDVLETLYAGAPGDPRILGQLFESLVLAGQNDQAKALLPLPVPTAQTRFYEALLFLDSGERAKAEALFRAAINADSDQPMAWYFLGTIEYDAGQYPQAQADFRKVLDLNANLTVALLPLARSTLAAGEYQEAYAEFLHAHRVTPGDEAISAELSALRKSHPQIEAARTEAKTQREQVARPPVVTTFPAGARTLPTIRVGLADKLRSITIKTGGNCVIRGANDAKAVDAASDTLIIVSDAKGEIRLAYPGAPPFASLKSPVTLSYPNPGDTTILFDLVTGSGDFYAASADHAYRGKLEFRSGEGGLLVINRLSLEEYLYSVLPSEMPAYWPMEALKAQAVAARSYTIASLGRFEKRGYDVQGSVISAAYGGVSNENRATTEAVNATEGLVLLHNDRPLMAFYGANTGGYTEDSRSVWGESAGMKAVPDLLIPERRTFLSLSALGSWLTSYPKAYDATAPYYSRDAYRWQKWVPASEIARRVAETRDVGPVHAILTRGRGISGRVNDIEIIGSKGSIRVRGDIIRWTLGGLRSNLFTVRPKLGTDGLPQYFIFEGAGWGHGVGMDQSGAAGMAAAGFDFRQILLHYYPLARIGTYKPDR